MKPETHQLRPCRLRPAVLARAMRGRWAPPRSEHDYAGPFDRAADPHRGSYAFRFAHYADAKRSCCAFISHDGNSVANWSAGTAGLRQNPWTSTAL